jgi:hypothetical protein
MAEKSKELIVKNIQQGFQDLGEDLKTAQAANFSAKH